MLLPTQGVWRENGGTVEAEPGQFAREPEFYLALDFFLNNLQCLHDTLLYADSLRWFLSESIDKYSYAWACDILEIEPESAREEILDKHLDPLKLLEHPEHLTKYALCPVLTLRVKGSLKYKQKLKRKGKLRRVA